jgi:hypothetical protein
VNQPNPSTSRWTSSHRGGLCTVSAVLGSYLVGIRMLLVDGSDPNGDLFLSGQPRARNDTASIVLVSDGRPGQAATFTRFPYSILRGKDNGRDA